MIIYDCLLRKAGEKLAKELKGFLHTGENETLRTVPVYREMRG